MENIKAKAINIFNLAKKYWSTPAKGNYVPYKEVAYLGGAGFGVNWSGLLAGTIGLDASNFLVGASIGLKPMDLQVMLIVANIIGIPMGIFRSWYFDNHNLKGGKFLPFLRRTAMPMVLISLIFVWLPYENWEYITKAIIVEIMYLLLNVFLCFYNDSYTYFQQIISPNAQERATVMSISQIIYSLAPSITNFAIPLIAGLTWGLNNIWTYRVVYPVFVIVGLVMSTIFFRKVKERLILPKRKPDPVRIMDAVREVAKNKYYWIIHAAAWVVFLESGYGVILSWSFVYAHGGQYAPHLGLANTIIGNAALWSMLLAPIAIKAMGKRNLLITVNTINIFVLIILYFTYQNLIIICVLWFFNNFFNTFWNIVQHNIQADMKDYHQWKTGVRIDGLFGPLGLIGTFIGFFTGMIYPAIYEKMGLGADYNVLYDDAVRNNLFEVLIICSAFGALLNLIPFLFYDLTENKHRGYVDVLRIRAMFENYGMGALEDEELSQAMEIIHKSKSLVGREKIAVDKTALKEAKNMPHKTDEEKSLRSAAIKKAKAEISETKETNLAIERNYIIIEDLEKFSTEASKQKLAEAERTVARGPAYFYENAKDELREARHMPKTNAQEREIRSDAIKLARIKKESASLIRRYGAEGIKAPDESIKEEIINRETHSFAESLKQRSELKKYLKEQSVYMRVTKPYRDAENYITQWKNYTHYEELEERYARLGAEI